MNIKDIYSELIKRKIEGIMFHEQAMEIMLFFGFDKLYEKQSERFISESSELCEINEFLVKQHNLIVRINEPSDQKLIPSMWYDYTRFDISNNTKQTFMKEFFEKWYEWEKETRDIFLRMSKEAFNEGEIIDFIKINKMAKCTNKEVEKVQEMILKFKSMDFSISCYY